MALKLFILGRPGSGKTTSARHITRSVECTCLRAIHMNDYEILKQMFRDDTEHKKFRPTDNDGFDVVDFSVMETALQELEKRIESYLTSADIITIEFARDDYSVALQQFHSEFFSKDAYFLYLDATIETCLRRIHERVARHSSLDDHPSLSDDSFRTHYQKDNRPYISSGLRIDFGIDDERVTVIDNEGSIGELRGKLDQFVKNIPLVVPA